MRFSAIVALILLTFGLGFAYAIRTNQTHSLTGGGIGVNVPDLLKTGPVFADAVKQARPWKSSQPLREDTDGNVTYLAPGQVARTSVYSGVRYPVGTYTLLYDGSGTFSISSNSSAIIRRSPGRITVRIDKPARSGIQLALTNVDSGDYPRNVHLFFGTVPPSGAPFTRRFINSLERYGVIRFANWMHGNTYAVSTVWPERPTTHSFTQAGDRGVAIEYMIALANATGDDPWFTIPVGATDYWVENFTQLLSQNLDPRLHPIIEYGDEVWRRDTPAYRYASMAARNVGLNGDPIAWYSQRSIRIFALVQQGLGAGKPFVRVLSGPMPDVSIPANAQVDRTILSDSNASQFADAFAVSGQTDGLSSQLYAQTLAAAERFTRSAHLSLLAYDGGDPIEYWTKAGGGLFIANPTLAAWYVARHASPHMQPTFAPFVDTPAEARDKPRRSTRFVSPGPMPTPLE